MLSGRTGIRRLTAAALLMAGLMLAAVPVRAEALGEPVDGIVWPEQTIGVLPQTDAALPSAASFSVIIPDAFHQEEGTGRYICERWPLDAATVTVDITELDSEEQYTNAQKREMKERGETVRQVRKDYARLTALEFEKALSATLEEGLTLKVKDFVHTTTKRASDGASFPGYRITTEITGESRSILQEIYIILSEDKICTVTYAQASDDEFAEIYKKSAATIKVY